MARHARADLGRAIRAARLRRSIPASTPLDAPGSVALAHVPRGRDRRAIAALVAVAAVLLAFALVPRRAGPPLALSAASLPTATASVDALDLTGERGRSEGLSVTSPGPLAARSTPTPTALGRTSSITSASASPTRAPLPTPTTAPPPRPSPPSAASPAPAVVASPPSSPTATVSPPATPPPVAPGYSRLIVLVVDAATQRPVANACIVIGAPDCGPTRPHTNSLGLWWIDFPTGLMSGAQWQVAIVKDGYGTLNAVVTTTGTDQQFLAPLVPVP